MSAALLIQELGSIPGGRSDWFSDPYSLLEARFELRHGPALVSRVTMRGTVAPNGISVTMSTL